MARTNDNDNDNDNNNARTPQAWIGNKDHASTDLEVLDDQMAECFKFPYPQELGCVASGLLHVQAENAAT
ncbi:hypothetical protein HL42_7820 [Trichophyton rubrum]|nr:hypothetical protein HL42_7820 [Trichophyton rubrum]